MPSVAEKIWTGSRQFMGNLVPGLLSFPFAACGGFLWKPDEPLAPLPLCLMAIFPIAGWLSLSAFGLWSNASMRDELGKRFGRERGRPDGEMQFVGYATPQFRSLLDPHEDVGFLILHPDKLEIFGDARHLTIPRKSVTQVRLGRNTHSWVWLGGWVVIEAGDQTILIESRQRDTLLGNKRNRLEFLRQIEAWRQSEKIPAKTPKES